jgi:hypothetical protein
MFGIGGIAGAPGAGSGLSDTSALPNAPPCAFVTRPLTVDVCADTTALTHVKTNVATRGRNLSIVNTSEYESTRTVHENANQRTANTHLKSS